MQSLVSHAKKEKHKWIQDLCLKSDLCFRKVTPVPGQVWGGGGGGLSDSGSFCEGPRSRSLLCSDVTASQGMHLEVAAVSI